MLRRFSRYKMYVMFEPLIIGNSLILLLIDKCTYTQRDIKRKFNDQGIDVSLRTINTILKKNKITPQAYEVPKTK